MEQSIVDWIITWSQGIRATLTRAFSAKVDPDQAIKEALDYAAEISDQYADEHDAVARAAERWNLDFDMLWRAWKK
jgi:copper homeostasis protein CutC